MTHLAKALPIAVAAAALSSCAHTQESQSENTVADANLPLVVAQPKVAGRPGATFLAVKAPAAPTLDGAVSPGEWDSAIAYPYLYNQLADLDKRPTGPQSDIRGRWRVMFRGGTLYGLVERWDDVTESANLRSWENDCLEIFFSIDGQWKQYRTVVGQDWLAENEVPGKAVWSKDGSVLEFSVKLPKDDLTGLTIGWNTALADNDKPGGSVRKCQLYPVVGNNTSWQGKGYGELTFANAKGAFVPGAFVSSPPPFVAFHIAPDGAPAIDGKGDDVIWSSAPLYPLGFELLSAKDQSVPDEKDVIGDWRLLVAGKNLYGLLHRRDDKTVTSAQDPRKNDHVEIDLTFASTKISLVTVVGSDFVDKGGAAKAHAAWSEDGTVLEFSIEVPADLPKEALWSIGLFDNDDGPEADVKHALFPFPGYVRAVKGAAAKATEFGKLQLQ